MTPKATAKAALFAISPALVETVHAYRMWQLCRRRYGPMQDKLRAKIYGQGPIQVLSGPFKGLRYATNQGYGPIAPKWLGSYEAQLHPIIEYAAHSGAYRTIIDVGAAEGYYAVGLAWLIPRATVFSYDIDLFARRIQRRLAHANGVTNLRINGRCSHGELTRRIHGRTLVICDIEGFEYELLDPVNCPALAGCDILVELHAFQRFAEEVVEREMVARFQKSHTISRIQDTSPEQRKYEALIPNTSPEELESALNEDRAARQTWLWMRARNQSA